MNDSCFPWIINKKLHQGPFLLTVQVKLMCVYFNKSGNVCKNDLIVVQSDTTFKIDGTVINKAGQGPGQGDRAVLLLV